MIEIIPSETRGNADHGWLKAKHTFSFADYHNPQRVHFGPLRVINEDRIAPAQGFGTHPHKDMEIITYPISGAIEHKDSMGNGTVIRAGEVQRMTAGSGIQHSEFNHSKEDELHLLQIWMFPEQKDLEPGYEQKMFSREDKLDQLRLIASRDGRDGSVSVHQRVDLYAGILQKNTEINHAISDSNKVFVQVVYGDVAVNGQNVSAGDGIQISNEENLLLESQSETEILVFDMG
jgi:redox-sensitive bicupin YhaK (pirin superfamily)